MIPRNLQDEVAEWYRQENELQRLTTAIAVELKRKATPPNISPETTAWFERMDRMYEKRRKARRS
jgi:hypothetical protein